MSAAVNSNHDLVAMRLLPSMVRLFGLMRTSACASPRATLITGQAARRCKHGCAAHIEITGGTGVFGMSGGLRRCHCVAFSYA